MGNKLVQMLQDEGLTKPSSYFNQKNKCETSYENRVVCGTDGRNYANPSFLRCEQNKEYGKRVNLQLSHEMPCWIWEQYGFGTSTLCIVSKR